MQAFLSSYKDQIYAVEQQLINSPPPSPINDARELDIIEIDQDPEDHFEIADYINVEDEGPPANIPPAPTPSFTTIPPAISPQETLNALIDRINASARLQGYAVRILNTTKTRGIVRSAYICCTLEGHHRVTHPYIKTFGRIRTKHPRSKRTGCPFKLYARLDANNKWIYTPKHVEHNHEPDDTPRTHHQHRKPTDNEKDAIIASFNAGISASKILELVRQLADREHRSTYVSIREIYNLKTRYFSYGNQGRTFTDELMTQLKEAGFNFRHKVGSVGELTHLIITEPMALALMRRYGYVLYMDCTYKTNMYQLPLLNVVATTCANTSFTVAFAFLAREKEVDYLWAMQSLKAIMGEDLPVATVLTDNEKGLRNALSTTFPEWNQLLCIWHINKNIVTNCKPGLAEETFNAMLAGWTAIVQAPTQECFASMLEDFTKLYGIDKPLTSAACTYMVNLFKDKQHFAKHLTNGLLHFNNIATSVAESSHAAIKRSLNGTTGNLFQTTKNVLRYMSATQAKIFLEHAIEHRAKLLHLPDCFALVSRIVCQDRCETHILVIGSRESISASDPVGARTVLLSCEECFEEGSSS
jgi:hypothetical protein